MPGEEKNQLERRKVSPGSHRGPVLSGNGREASKCRSSRSSQMKGQASTPQSPIAAAGRTAFGKTTFRERVSLLSLPSPSDVSLP